MMLMMENGGRQQLLLHNNIFSIQFLKRVLPLDFNALKMKNQHQPCMPTIKLQCTTSFTTLYRPWLGKGINHTMRSAAVPVAHHGSSVRQSQSIKSTNAHRAISPGDQKHGTRRSRQKDRNMNSCTVSGRAEVRGMQRASVCKRGQGFFES